MYEISVKFNIHSIFLVSLLFKAIISFFNLSLLCNLENFGKLRQVLTISKIIIYAIFLRPLEHL